MIYITYLQIAPVHKSFRAALRRFKNYKNSSLSRLEIKIDTHCLLRLLKLKWETHIYTLCTRFKTDVLIVKLHLNEDTSRTRLHIYARVSTSHTRTRWIYYSRSQYANIWSGNLFAFPRKIFFCFSYYKFVDKPCLQALSAEKRISRQNADRRYRLTL